MLELCADIWDMMDVSISLYSFPSSICFPASPASIALQHYYISSTASSAYLLGNVDCSGNKSSLSDCRHNGIGVYNFNEGGREAGVICNCKFAYTVYLIATAIFCSNLSPDRECNESDIRLINGKTPDDGRVEICLDGGWGSVCYDRWDIRDAEVVCRQLGYDGRESLPISFYCFSLLFLPASYPQLSPTSRSDPLYVLDDVHCMGIESKLSDCSHSGVGIYDCYSGEAGLCSFM